MPCSARDVSVLGSLAGQFTDRKTARCGPMTRPDLIDLLRQNYIAYFRLFHGQHGVCVHEDEQAAWIIANGPPGNHILRSNFPSDNVEEGIDALLADIGARTEACRWLCFPGDLPHDLGDRLVSRGLDAGEGDFWMFRPLDELPHRACPDGLRVISVSTGPGLRSWWTASARGFGMSQRAAQLWYDAYRRHALEAGAYARFYSGLVGREVVTSGTLILAGGIAGIYDISTPQAYRGKGFASALVSYILAAARTLGYAYAGLQTANEGTLYRRLGFEVGFREREFFWIADG